MTDQKKPTSPELDEATTAKAQDAPTNNEAGSVKNPIIIKKYANRRLYNTHSSSYVTLEHLNQMVRKNIEFIVCDAKTGDDITRSILTQIILEEENKEGQTLLPIGFLRQLIGFYGDRVHQMTLPHYLEISMQSFQENQKQFRNMAQENFANFFPIPNMPNMPAPDLEAMGKQNMVLMQNAMRMFNPLSSTASTAPKTEPTPNTQNQTTNPNAELDALKQQLTQMQAQLSSLMPKS